MGLGWAGLWEALPLGCPQETCWPPSVAPTLPTCPNCCRAHPCTFALPIPKGAPRPAFGPQGLIAAGNRAGSSQTMRTWAQSPPPVMAQPGASLGGGEVYPSSGR